MLGRDRVSSRAVAPSWKRDRSVLRPVQAADAVEQARLAGAVGADDGVDVALADGEADVVQSAARHRKPRPSCSTTSCVAPPREAASVEIVTVPARHAAQNTLSLCESRAKHATPLCEIDCPYAYTRSMSQVDDVPRGTLGTVRNATLLLELLAQGAAFQQLTELAERSGLSLPTVHRLLRSLVAAGLVEQDPDSARYGLGAELVRLAERYLSRLPIFRAVSPYLVELRNSTGATVLAALLVRGQVVYFDRVDGADAGGIFREPTPHASRPRDRGRPAVDRSEPDDSWEDAVAASRNGSFTLADRKRWAKASYVVLVDDNSLAEVAVPILGSERALTGVAGGDRKPAAIQRGGSHRGGRTATGARGGCGGADAEPWLTPTCSGAGRQLRSGSPGSTDGSAVHEPGPRGGDGSRERR